MSTKNLSVELQKKKGLERTAEVIEALFIWLVILFIVIGSYLFPYNVTIVVLIFNIYFLFYSFKITIFVVLNTIKVKVNEKIDWLLLLDLLNNPNAAETTYENILNGIRNGTKISLKQKIKTLISKQYIKTNLQKIRNAKSSEFNLKPKDIKHVFIVPTAFEPYELINRLLKSITSQTICEDYKDNILILVGQEIENKNYKDVQEKILSTLDSEKIKDIWFSIHTLDPITELKGKSANVTSVAKNLFPKIKDELNWNPKNTLVHIVDTPVILDKNYAAACAFEFATQKNYREYKIYSSCIVYYNNIWEIPLPNRLANIWGSLFNIYTLGLKNEKIPISTYTTTIFLAESAGYWDPKVIPEDFHYFYNAFYQFGSKVDSVPINLFTGKDAAQSVGNVKTIKNQYKQFQRWAYGVSDVGFVVRNTLERKSIPLILRFNRFLSFFKVHFFWPTTWFFTVFGNNMPFLLNKDFRDSVTGVSVPSIISFITNLLIVLFIIMLFTDIYLKPKHPTKPDNFYIRILGLIQWLTYPIISFFYSSLPSIDAHTRILFGKYMQYKITDKVAPKENPIKKEG